MKSDTKLLKRQLYNCLNIGKLTLIYGKDRKCLHFFDIIVSQVRLSFNFRPAFLGEGARGRAHEWLYLLDVRQISIILSVGYHRYP